MSQHRKSRVAALNDTTDAAFALAMLWAIPALAFVFMFIRV